LSTYSAFAKDTMEISLENSLIKLFIRIGNSEAVRILIVFIFENFFNKRLIYFHLTQLKTMVSSEGFNDGKWHTIKVIREGARLILQVDYDEPATGSSFSLC
jgi:hypothetical protein